MPVPQVFRAVRRGTAPLNVLDLVEVAGQFAGCEALARRRSRQLVRPGRAVQPLRVARGITGGGLRSACIGGCKGTFTSTSSCTVRLPMITAQPNADWAGASRARIISDRLPGVRCLRIAFDTPEARRFELVDTSSFGRQAFGRRLTALDSPRGARLV